MWSNRSTLNWEVCCSKQQGYRSFPSRQSLLFQRKVCELFASIGRHLDNETLFCLAVSPKGATDGMAQYLLFFALEHFLHSSLSPRGSSLRNSLPFAYCFTVPILQKIVERIPLHKTRVYSASALAQSRVKSGKTGKVSLHNHIYAQNIKRSVQFPVILSL